MYNFASMATEHGQEVPTEELLKSAREAVTRAITTPNFDGIVGIRSLVRLHNELLKSNMPPELIYNELSINSKQLLTVAKDANSEETIISTISDMDTGFNLSHRDFSPKPAIPVEPAQPTQTESLPMSDAKGASRPQVAQQTARREDPPKTLSARDQEVIQVLKQAQGKTIDIIAGELEIQPQTLRTYVSILRSKGVIIQSTLDEARKITGFFISEENTAGKNESSQ